MPSLNRLQLIGRLGKDPETRFTPTGKQVVSFSLAVDNFWRDKEGQRHQETEWFNIEAWGHLGEICAQYLRKGQLVYLEGRVKTDRFESDGQTRYYTKVILQSMQMLERKSAEAEPEALAESPEDYFPNEE